MVDIISRRDGPRPEDERLRRVIDANRPTLNRMADHLTNGAWSARKQQPAATGPEPSGLMIHTARASTATEPPKPFVRIAVNGRVSMVDSNTGRQMHHLGDIRRRDGVDSFRLATSENGFFSPVDPDLATALASLDGEPVRGRDGERALIEAIGVRLQL